MSYEHGELLTGRDTMTDVRAKKPEPKDSGYSRLIRMRRFANGLLVLIMGLFVFSHMWEPPGQDWDMAWRFVRAFAEAAMVGGLADWFAVTAIFRRPLGLPIPHTAVIPNNQDRIADAVGRFIADNFLKPELVAARVQEGGHRLGPHRQAGQHRAVEHVRVEPGGDHLGRALRRDRGGGDELHAPAVDRKSVV